MPRVSAEARLHRLLALVPWVAGRDGPRIDEVCARFGCTEAELAADLDLLFVCGLHPYTPDMLIDVDVADGRVWIRYAEYFSGPLRLTPGEALALLVAGQAMLAAPGADPSGPLARGLDKVAATLGVDPRGAVDVTLGPAPAGVLETLSQAASDHRRVEIDYYSFGRDQWGQRTVDPFAVFSAGGQWYLSGHCHSVDDERLFRVDRIRSVRALEASFTPPAAAPELSVFRPRPSDPRVSLEVGPSGHWLADQYPVEAVEDLGEGRLRVRLAVGQKAWLERLLLRLGPAATVVEGDAGTGRLAACRLLARYRADAAASDPA